MRERAVRLAWLLTGLTVLAEIAYPLVSHAFRAPLSILTVALFFAASVVHAAATRGLAWTAMLVVVTAGGGLLAESVGVATGLPFGSYHYTAALGPTWFAVPVVIPLAWTMMAYPAYTVAVRLCRTRVARIVVAAWALASWDVFLDPQMVDAGYWRWRNPGSTLPGVSSVPLGNYAGWLAVAVVMMALLIAGGALVGEPARINDTAPIALYLWTYFSSILAHGAFFGLPWSALWGGVLMGLVALPLISSLRSQERT